MIKNSGYHFTTTDGWQVGDKVECVCSDHHAYSLGEVFVLVQSLVHDGRLKFKNGYTGKSAKFVKAGCNSKGKGFAKWMRETESV